MGTRTVEVTTEEAFLLEEFRQHGHEGVSAYSFNSAFRELKGQLWTANERYNELDLEARKFDRNMAALRTWLLLEHRIKLENALEEAIKNAYDWMSV